MKNLNSNKSKTSFPITVKDLGITVLCLLIASSICIFLQSLTSNDTHVPLIFVLAVFITSLMTEGYALGVIASVFSVFFVNWAFTFPYKSLDFSVYGYPITFVTMLTVSIVTSTLMSRYKQQGQALRNREAEKIRVDFLRSISHDLRTPLSVIIGDSEMVLANEDKPENTYLLNDIKDNADWLVRMVENILSITKINGDVGQINKNDEIPEEIVGSIIEKFKKKNPEVEFEVVVPDEVFFVPMDCMLIEQLFMNLFENAVVHGHCSKIIVSLERKNGFALFRVSDNGIGIDSKHIKDVFNVGSQNYSGSSDSNKFMGIGLAVCKTIVEAHGGNISAETTDVGAEFAFSLALN